MKIVFRVEQSTVIVSHDNNATQITENMSDQINNCQTLKCIDLDVADVDKFISKVNQVDFEVIHLSGFAVDALVRLLENLDKLTQRAHIIFEGSLNVDFAIFKRGLHFIKQNAHTITFNAVAEGFIPELAKELNSGTMHGTKLRILFASAELNRTFGKAIRKRALTNEPSEIENEEEVAEESQMDEAALIAEKQKIFAELSAPEASLAKDLVKQLREYLKKYDKRLWQVTKTLPVAPIDLPVPANSSKESLIKLINTVVLKFIHRKRFVKVNTRPEGEPRNAVRLVTASLRTIFRAFAFKIRLEEAAENKLTNEKIDVQGSGKSTVSPWEPVAPSATPKEISDVSTLSPPTKEVVTSTIVSPQIPTTPALPAPAPTPLPTPSPVSLSNSTASLATLSQLFGLFDSPELQQRQALLQQLKNDNDAKADLIRKRKEEIRKRTLANLDAQIEQEKEKQARLLKEGAELDELARQEFPSGTTVAPF